MEAQENTLNDFFVEKNLEKSVYLHLIPNFFHLKKDFVVVIQKFR